jgi:hypothetical protein
MSNSTKRRRTMISLVLVISLLGAFNWVNSSRHDKAQAAYFPFWVPATYDLGLGNPFVMLSTLLTLLPFLVWIPQKKRAPKPRQPSDAPIALMYYISDCALHKGAQYAKDHAQDWTVGDVMDKAMADCQWANESTSDYGSDSWLAEDAFSQAGEGEGLAALADTFCKSTTNQMIKDAKKTPDARFCIGTFGMNVVPDHYQFIVFSDGTVQWAIHRGAFESYPNYPIVGSSSGLTPNFSASP